MLCVFDYDPETNEYTPVSQELVKEEAKKKTTSKKKTGMSEEEEESSEPLLKLESNKYILNAAAANLLGVSPEDRLDIKYEKVDTILFPIIGSCDSFGTKGGNKLTNSYTVSCRGKAQEMLAKYGTVFSFTNHKNKKGETLPGLFVLIGDSPLPVQEVKDNNVVIEDEEGVSDLPSDFELMNLEDNGSTEITEFDFTL